MARRRGDTLVHAACVDTVVVVHVALWMALEIVWAMEAVIGINALIHPGVAEIAPFPEAVPSPRPRRRRVGGSIPAWNRRWFWSVVCGGLVTGNETVILRNIRFLEWHVWFFHFSGTRSTWFFTLGR